MHVQLSKVELVLINKRLPILLHKNVRTHIARTTLQKLTDLKYETLLHLSYTPDLSLTD